ncbi:MAG: energy-coupling factor transporter ATPase [Anaerolineae bacterium]
MSQDPIIRVENVSFAYHPESRSPIFALQDINLEVHHGDYLAIVGHNGSGKSTLAKHFNALLLPTEGDVWVRGMNTREQKHLLQIRQTVGLVFQTPDTQIVATTVEQDVAFGPENLGIPRGEILERVAWALNLVGMQAHRHRAPHLLSAGQKQRVAIAGIMAMKPQVLVLDESTAMLDPLGKAQLLDTVRQLHEAGTTVVAITHTMSEAVEADRVVVLAEGRIVAQGPPAEVFQDEEGLGEVGLEPPPISHLAHLIARQVPGFPTHILTLEELADAVCQRRAGRAT